MANGDYSQRYWSLANLLAGLSAVQTLALLVTGETSAFVAAQLKKCAMNTDAVIAVLVLNLIYAFVVWLCYRAEVKLLPTSLQYAIPTLRWTFIFRLLALIVFAALGVYLVYLSRTASCVAIWEDLLAIVWPFGE